MFRRRGLGGFYTNTRAILFRAVCAAVMLAIVALIIDARARPIVRELAVTGAKNSAVSLASQAVTESLTLEGIDYEGLVTVTKDSSGNISAVLTDTVKLNLLKASVCEKLTEKFEELGEYELAIPLGALTGIETVAGIGPKIKIKMKTTGSAVPSVRNEFSSAGINQTLHSIILDLDLSVYVYAGKSSGVTKVESSVCIAQTVIVGTVPQVY